MSASIGASYGIFDTQVASNRMYNLSSGSVKDDYELANDKKKIKKIDRKCRRMPLPPLMFSQLYR